MANLKMKFLEPTRSMRFMRNLTKSSISLTIMDVDECIFPVEVLQGCLFLSFHVEFDAIELISIDSIYTIALQTDFYI